MPRPPELQEELNRAHKLLLRMMNKELIDDRDVDDLVDSVTFIKYLKQLQDLEDGEKS